MNINIYSFQTVASIYDSYNTHLVQLKNNLIYCKSQGKFFYKKDDFIDGFVDNLFNDTYFYKTDLFFIKYEDTIITG